MFSLFIGICFCSFMTTRAAVVKKNPTDLFDANSVRFPIQRLLCVFSESMFLPPCLHKGLLRLLKSKMLQAHPQFFSNKIQWEMMELQCVLN